MHSNINALERQPPIDSIPNEVLSEILILSKPHAPQLLHDALPHDFLRVCRHWRNVAHNTPRLWNSFKIELPRVLPQGSNFKLEQLLSVMLDWLEKSRPLPITVTLEADEEYNWDRDEASEVSVGTLVQTILEASYRWEDIEVVFFPAPFARRIVEAAYACAKSCARLVVDVPHEPMKKSSLPIPNITEVEIIGIPMTLGVAANLPSIRYLDLNSVDGPEFCIQLIECAPNLEEVRLTFTRRTMAYRGDPVVAEKLTLMDLTFDFDEGVRSAGASDRLNLFQKVIAPCLTTLFLSELTGRCTRFSHVHSITDFLARSRCEHNLQQFHFKNSNSNLNAIEIIHGICRLTTSLSKLDVRIWTRSSQFTEFFAPLQSKEHLPLLTDFTFRINDWPQNDGYVQKLRDFAQARYLHNGGKLENVTIVARYERRKFEVDEGEFLEKFSNIGVKFHVELDPWVALATGGPMSARRAQI